jgi:hypothetical protein
MKLLMTLLVRDEADIIDAQISFHLNAGVDYVIAMDHRSSDGTTEILESYERDGHLRLIRQDAEEVRQSEWVTVMARLAAVEHSADWVLNSDADEFWWPRARSLKEALAAVPASYGVVFAPMCYFLPRSGSGPFFERMTGRLIQSAPISSPTTRYRPVSKAAHRASATVVVRRGNHAVADAGRPLWSWHPLELLHFPDRSAQQLARKYRQTVSAWPRDGRAPGAFVLAAHEAVGRGAVTGAGFERFGLTDEELREAHAAGTVVFDPRLRDVLRQLRSPSSGFARPGSRDDPLDLVEPTLLDSVRHAMDAVALHDAMLTRLRRDVDDLDSRVSVLEAGGRARDP